MRAATRSLVERERELGVIAAGVKRLAEQRLGSALWLEGSPGIGKTALLRAAEQLAQNAGATTLVAAGAETEAGFPFEIARQALAPLALASDPRLERALDTPAEKLGAPIVRPDLAAATPEPVQAALYGLTALFASIAREGPLALLVDDLHWADPDSLRFVEYLARRCEQLAILLVVASLEPSQSPPPLPRDSDRFRRVFTCVRLDPLSEAGVRHLLTDAFAEAPPTGFVAALRARSGGNPLFVVELIDSLKRANLKPGARALRYLEEHCPASLSRLIEHRVARLSASARALCDAAAVLPGSCRLELAAELAGLPALEAGSALDELVAAGVVRFTDGNVRFLYPLVRSVVLRSLASARRADLHAAAARIMRRQGASDGEVAALLLGAPAGSDPEALATLVAAGTAALERGAAARAAAFLARALAEARGEPTRCELLFLLGRAELGAGSSDAIEHLRAATRAQDPCIALAAARALSRTLAMAGERDPAAPLRDTLAQFHSIDLDLHLAARTELAALTRAYLSTVGEGRDLIAQLQRLGATGRTAAGRAALAVIACDHALAGDAAATVVALAEQALACSRGELIGELSLGYLATSALIYADQLEAAAVALRRIIEAAAQAGAEMTELLAVGLAAVVDYRRGFVETAAAKACTVRHQAVEAGWGARQWVPVEVIAAALLEAADIERAEGLLEARLAEIDYDDGWAPAAARFELGRAALTRGDARRAARELAAAGAHLESWHAPSPGVLPWRSHLALAEAALGNEHAARALVEEDLHRAERAGLGRSQGLALRTMARLERRLDAARACHMLEGAVELLAREGAELELGWTELEFGSTLAERGYARDAKSRLRSAAARAERCRAQRLLEAARTRLATLGTRLPRERLLARSLTARELRVAELAAVGRSNREIADELTVTVKTVEYHLTNVYRKLGVRQRSELAQALSRTARWDSV